MVNLFKIPRLCEPICEYQRKDPESSRIMVEIESESTVQSNRLEGGLLLKKTRTVSNPYKILIPQSLQYCKIILKYYHDDGLSGGHVGIYRTLENIFGVILGMD